MDKKIKDRILTRLKHKLEEEIEDYKHIRVELSDLRKWKTARANSIREIKKEIKEIEKL